MIRHSKAIDYTKPVYAPHHKKWYVTEKDLTNDQFHELQLFHTCEACEDGLTYNDRTGRPKACAYCNGTGETHIDLPIKDLERLTELMKVKKPSQDKRSKEAAGLYANMVMGEVHDYFDNKYNQAQQEIKTLLG